MAGGQSTAPTKGPRQATIESLKGVVSVEKIFHLKTRLKLKGQSKQVLMESLEELNKKIPSREVLQSSRVGHTINRLTKHEDKDVANLASSIVNDWKAYYAAKRDRPKIEVKCDNKTEAQRAAGRKLLQESLDGQEAKILAEAIEREAFHQHGHLLIKGYKHTMRTLVFKLKQDPDIRDQVLKKSMSVPDFVKTYKKDVKTASIFR